MRIAAIIGTAGRKEDAARLTPQLWGNVQDSFFALLKRRPYDVLVSGGAAWADHLAVQAFNRGLVPELRLYLPAPWQGLGFRDTGGYGTSNPGGTTNYYHDKFSRVLDIDSFEEIEAARVHGAKVEVDPGGFFGRNNLIARDANEVIAFTFGTRHYHGPWISADKAGLKDGGTAHTWNQCQQVATAVHYCLGR